MALSYYLSSNQLTSTCHHQSWHKPNPTQPNQKKKKKPGQAEFAGLAA